MADDDPVTRRLVEIHLRRAGLPCGCFPDGLPLVEALSDDTAVILVDLMMPLLGGREVLRRARKLRPRAQVIFLTSVNEAREAVECLREGAVDYFTKPFDPEELILAVRRALKAFETSEEVAELRATVADPIAALGAFIGQGGWAQGLREELALLAGVDGTVLLTGESGTGKGVLARAIHLASPRAKGPFVAVSCPSMPRDLVESEMFGHERGAFSGAVQRRLGKAELAHRGTLFLDEIGEMPLDLQAKLLTFLQEKTFYRVGGEKLVQADVRLVAATNRDLPEMVRRGAFRQDLYYRLNVLPVRLIPLRERREDIEVLADHILQRVARAQRRPAFLTARAREALLGYDWPGNVRELENVLERAYAYARDGRIDEAGLPAEIRSRAAAPAAAPPPVLGLAGRSLAEIERAAISQTLRQVGGNRAEAARLLGVTEKTIYNKLKAAEAAGTPIPFDG